MNRLSFLRTVLLIWLIAATSAPPAAATCTCFPIGPGNGWPDPIVQNAGQLNLVVREGSTFRLVPNIRVQGDAQSFSLVVPTPSLPALAPADSRLWSDAAAMTQAVSRPRSFESGAFNCSDQQFFVAELDGAIAEDGVTVVSTQTVGDFEATIISSTSADSLVTWLEDNGYQISSEDAALFDPLVQSSWFFTAMKLTDSLEVPGTGWNTSVDPVEFTFTAPEFEIPLDILGINRAPFVPITVYSVDDSRMTLDGFDTLYSNRITARELTAIQDRFPGIAAYLTEGRTLTRLTRTLRDPDDFVGMLTLRTAGTQDEFRTIVRAGSPGAPGPADGHRYPADLLLLAAPFCWFKLRRGGSRRQR